MITSEGLYGVITHSQSMLNSFLKALSQSLFYIYIFYVWLIFDSCLRNKPTPAGSHLAPWEPRKTATRCMPSQARRQGLSFATVAFPFRTVSPVFFLVVFSDLFFLFLFWGSIPFGGLLYVKYTALFCMSSECFKFSCTKSSYWDIRNPFAAQNQNASN